MIDLHLHLDGSLLPSEIRYLARKAKVALPTENDEALFSLLSAKNATSLNDYLKRFDLPLAVLQSGDAVRRAVTLLSDRLLKKGYRYAEIRFAPLLHTRGGAPVREIAEGAIKGRFESFMDVNLIFCCMRGADRRLNLETVEAAAAFRECGVCGVDLAGAEALYPTENYKDVFELAMRENLNITIHAGEAAGADSIRAALDFGAKRIGHAVAARRDKALQERLKANGIAVELCPTSNVQTGAVLSIKDHPIGEFLDAGLRCCLSSDNMTVSDTDVFREWKKVQTAFGFEEKVFDVLMENAKNAEFR